MDIMTMLTETGKQRSFYSHNVEPHPSRFANEGRDYKEWAARADYWAAHKDEEWAELSDFVENVFMKGND